MLKKFFVLLCALTALRGIEAAEWAGFVDQSAELKTETFSFSGTIAEAMDSNENYYDGDFADFDGDGWMDRGLGSRYGLLKNTGGGLMTPFAGPKYINYLFRGFVSGWGEDAMQWADVDGDDDLDILQGGNGEPFTLQINQAGRFRTKWTKSGSALNIVNIDIDRDGDVDLAVAHAFCSDALCGHGCPEGDCQGGTWPKEFHLWVNDGNGNFTDQASTRGFANFGADLIVGVVAGDVDSDGDFDLMMINGIKRGITLARNDGTGKFTLSLIPFARALAAIRPVSSGFNQGMNLGDIDDDGDLDLVMALQRDTAGSPHPQVAHAILVNNGSGGFVEQTATRFKVTGFTGFMGGGNGKLLDADYDGDLDFFAFDFNATRHVQIFLNDGQGIFTYSSQFSKNLPGGDPGAKTGADNDVTDLNGDGVYDVWIGAAGSVVHPLINTFQPADGRAPNIPRNVRAAVEVNSVNLTWEHPLYADVARRYKVYRSTNPLLARRDWKLIKSVGYTQFQDEGFAAPITRHSTTASLNDPTLRLDGAARSVTFKDATALPGVRYYYAVTHIGTENTESILSSPVAAQLAAAALPDTTPPTIDIISPTVQDWSPQVRIVVQFADGGAGTDPATLTVALDKPLGDPAAGGRVAGADISDIFFAKDSTTFISALPPNLTLPTNSLTTLSVAISDLAGNRTTNQVQFFPLTKSTTLPVATLSAASTTLTAGETAILSANSSRDPDGKIFAYEWYFSDGTTAFGREIRQPLHTASPITATLMVRDAQGGTGTASTTMNVAPALRITAAQITDGQLSLSFVGPTGRAIIIEATTLLQPAGWEVVQNIQGTGSIQTITAPADATSRFFRLRLEN